MKNSHTIHIDRDVKWGNYVDNGDGGGAADGGDGLSDTDRNRLSLILMVVIVM